MSIIHKYSGNLFDLIKKKEEKSLEFTRSIYVLKRVQRTRKTWSYFHENYLYYICFKQTQQNVKSNKTQ